MQHQGKEPHPQPDEAPQEGNSLEDLSNEAVREMDDDEDGAGHAGRGDGG